VQLLLYTENIIVHVENPMEFTKKKKRPNRTNMLIYQGDEIQGHTQKLTVFLCSGNNKYLKTKNLKIIPFTTVSKNTNTKE